APGGARRGRTVPALAAPSHARRGAKSHPLAAPLRPQHGPQLPAWLAALLPLRGGPRDGNAGRAARRPVLARPHRLARARLKESRIDPTEQETLESEMPLARR